MSRNPLSFTTSHTSAEGGSKSQFLFPAVEVGKPRLDQLPMPIVDRQLLAGIVLVIPFAWFLAGATSGEATLVEGALTGFAAAVLVSAAQWQLFQAEGKSWKILLLHIGYFIVALKLAGVVLALFQ